MITNFEQYTHELTDEEKKLVPILIAGFKTKTKSNPITGADIVKAINSQKEKFGIKTFSEPRLRKICNFIRAKGILPLISTSNGYYLSYDKEELRKQILSLNERADAIRNSAAGLEKMLEMIN